MFQKFIDNRKLGGLNCLIYQNGEVIYQESCGYRNLETGERMTMDTIFRIASMSKVVTSVLAMILYEQNKLELTDPITKWFPQFKKMKVIKPGDDHFEYANREISVLDLLTHRAGFTYSDFLTGNRKDEYRRKLGGDIDSERTIEEWINGLASLPLVNQPGEIFSYGKATDLLGILISRIEGKPLGSVMQEKLFGRLSMFDTFFDVPVDKQYRCASNMGYDSSGRLVNLETVPGKMAFAERSTKLEFQSGGSGLWSTINDYLQIAKLFIENGCVNSVRVLKPESIALMCSNRLTPYQLENSSIMGVPMFREHYGYGLGVAVVLKEPSIGSMPCAGSVGSIGWPGAYGGWWSADPEKNSVSVFLTHSMTDLDQLAQGIGFELYEAIEIFASYSKDITGRSLQQS